MFTKPKGWLTGAIWKPKNLHSLEHLKFLHSVLCKNEKVTEQNKSLLVETLRSISEILIWGDQNDSSVFDFFLEKNMLAFFLRFMRQKSGRYICVQLLQTLNILFENISNETSVYYLLSNNHINSIIVHKFDFSDEEVMAYYISFLKTLSLKLNKHTIHFFYNEHTNDFALYTEAIKFFNHPESMVRIAVRTITLNVYKVDDKSMLRYIRDKTAAPYFSNLVWFIGNHIIELDSCVRNDADHNSRDRLADLVAEHLDHLHYLNDILCLNIDALNEVLTDHLLNRLLIPLYVYSLTKRRKFSARTDDRPHVSSVVSLFLLSQVFLIISHTPLVRQLADIIFNGDLQVCMGDTPGDTSDSPQVQGKKGRLRGFVKPSESLAKTLESNRSPGKPVRRPNYKNAEETTSHSSSRESSATPDQSEEGASCSESGKNTPDSTEGSADVESRGMVSPGQNSTDEEKLLQGGATTIEQRQAEFSLKNRPYLEAVFSALECSDSDYEALFGLCLLYALGHNLGLNKELLDSVLMPTENSETKDHYNIVLIEKLIHLINLSCETAASKVRLATLEMATLLLKQLVYTENHCFLQDRHLAATEGAREESTLLLRNFYKSEEIFLDMFEDEYREMKNRPLNVEYLMMDASILLPPTGTPLTGIEFNKRLPCGEVERARRAIRVFFLLRHLSLTLRQEEETFLPLTKQEECVKVNDVLDLNNSDLIACTVITRDQQAKRERRFLVIDLLQLILVEPDTRRLGWGVVKFVGFLQDVEVTGDKDDSRSLHITIHKPSLNMHARPLPLLSARFVFDDHIRCMAAKQRLTKGRLKARQRKMQMIARLLELPTHIVDAIYQAPQYPQSATSLRTHNNSGQASGGTNLHGRLVRHPGQAQGRRGSSGQSSSEVVKRSVFASVEQVPGFSAAKSKEHHSRKSASSKRALSQPIPIRAPVGGAVRQVVGPMPVGAATSAAVSEREASPEIEEAQEATPSPEAHAFQSLNSSAHDSQLEPGPRNGRGSRSSSSDRTPGVQEIPLEDMSKRARAAKANRHRRIDDEHKRSSSHSPHRGSESKTPPSPRASPVGSLSRADGRQRKGSLPLAKEDSSEQEEAATHGDEGAATPPVVVGGRRSRSSSGTGAPPATLMPAAEPAVSLVQAAEESDTNNPVVLIAAASDTPNLLPETQQAAATPDDDAHIAASSMDVDEVQSGNSTSPGDATTRGNKPIVPFAISTKCESSVDENQTAAEAEKMDLAPEENYAAAAVKEQLTRMAQQPPSALADDVCDDNNTGNLSIPLSPTHSTTSNATDELKEQSQL